MNQHRRETCIRKEDHDGQRRTTSIRSSGWHAKRLCRERCRLRHHRLDGACGGVRRAAARRRAAKGALAKPARRTFRQSSCWASSRSVCSATSPGAPPRRSGTRTITAPMPKGLAVRGGLAVSAVTHTFLAIFAISLIFGLNGGGSDDGSGTAGLDRLADAEAVRTVAGRALSGCAVCRCGSSLTSGKAGKAGFEEHLGMERATSSGVGQPDLPIRTDHARGRLSHRRRLSDRRGLAGGSSRKPEA